MVAGCTIAVLISKNGSKAGSKSGPVWLSGYLSSAFFIWNSVLLMEEV